PPPPPPSGQAPPPPPPASPAPQAEESWRPEARPVVTHVEVHARVVVFTEGGPGQPRGTKEVQVGLQGTPDPDFPASASLDRIWTAIQAKTREFLGAL